MIGGDTDRPRAWRADQPYTAGVVCAKVARYAERIHHPDRLTQPLAARRPEGLGAVRADRLGRGARPRRRGIPEGRARARRGKRLALFLRRHDGPRDARRHRAADPRQALFPLLRHHLHRHRLARLYRRNRAHVRHFAARNGQVRRRRDLGHQRGRDPGQSDDPRDARAQRARREDRRHRHLPDRDDAAGRPRAAVEARNRRRARLRGDARRCSATASPTATTWRAMPTRREALEAHLADRATPDWASAITGLAVDEIEAFAALVGRHKRTFFRLGYGFSRQRNGAANMHAALCIPAVTGAWAHEGGGALHAISARLQARQDADRGPRRARRERAPARPVAASARS